MNNESHLKELKVFMLPFAESNPYQTKLSQSLKQNNVKVKGSLKQFFIIELLKFRPDVIHFHWLQVYFLGRTELRGVIRLVVFLLQIAIVKLFNISIVWTAHNLVNHEKKSLKLDKFVTQLITRLASKIIVHSNNAKKQLLEYLPDISALKVTVVEHGHFIDDYPLTLSKQAARENLSLPPEHFIVLFLGQIREYKGVEDLIQAFLSLPKRSDFTLLIAGNPYCEELRNALMDAIPEGVNITFKAEFIPDEQVATYFVASDVSVLPYKSILTSGALVLAMGFGKSVIIPEIGSLKETAHPDATLTYKTNDLGDLADALETAYKNRETLTENGTFNAQKISACSWEMVGHKTNAVYRSS